MKIQSNVALLVIDVQNGFDSPIWGGRNNPDAECKVGILLNAFRSRGGTIVHIQHLSTDSKSPLYPGQVGCDIKSVAAPLPGENIFQKQVNSAFIGTGLEAYLRKRRIDTLVIAGLTTPHCVSTTTRMAANLGFRTYVASDATAAFDLKDVNGEILSADLVHRFALAELKNEFATILSVQQILEGL